MVWHLWHIFQCQLSLFQLAFYVQITVDSLIWPRCKEKSQAGLGLNMTPKNYKGTWSGTCGIFSSVSWVYSNSPLMFKSQLTA